MLIDALVTDKGDAILRQTPADLIGTPLLLRQFFFDQLHQIWRHFARLVRGLLASLRGLLVRLLEAIAARAGVANKLAADRRRIDANLPRDVGLRAAALQERVNLAALFAGQMEIAFGHFSSVRCAVPRKDSLPSDRQKNRHTQHGKVWREKTSASRVLAALASSPATKALDPDPFPRHSLRHPVYAALLHFGFETALHYVLDLWFERVVKSRLRGEARLVRYIDDFVICFQYRSDAIRVQDALRLRLGKFGLTLEPTKTKLVEFGRFAQRHAGKRGRKRPETIYFLGLTLYCTRNLKGNFKVGMRTEKSRLRRSLLSLQELMRHIRHHTIGDQVGEINAVLRGHYAYYGVAGNLRCLVKVYRAVERYWCRMLRSRSWAGRRFTWEKYLAYPVVTHTPDM